MLTDLSVYANLDDDEDDQPNILRTNIDFACEPKSSRKPAITDNFLQAKEKNLQFYSRANGNQRLFSQNSLVLLAGPPKIGKTTIAIALAKAIAQGKTFGGFPMEQAAAGFLSFDDSPGEILATLDRHADVNQTTPLYLSFGGDPIDTPSGQEQIENFLIKHKGEAVLFIDSLHAAIRKSQTKDARAVRKFIDPLKRIAERAGTIILLHHTDSRGNQIADHTQLQAAVSQTIQMKLEQRENHRIIQWISKGRGTGICRIAHFRSENETHYAPHNPDPLANLDPRDISTEPILKALQNGILSLAELVAETRLCAPTVKYRLTKLLKTGAVKIHHQRMGPKRYKLAI
ncbi:MAG: AAA family ATPase [Armatimonadota bacterium]